MLEAEGVDLLFAPDETRALSASRRAYMRAAAGPLGEELEGRFRPGLLRRRGTVVLKLFNCVQPRARGVRQEGLPAAHDRARHGAPARPADRDRRRRDGARGRRPRDELAQHLPLARPSAPRRRGCTACCSEVTQRHGTAPQALRELAARGLAARLRRGAPPRTILRCRSRATRSWSCSAPRAWARTRLIDNLEF